MKRVDIIVRQRSRIAQLIGKHLKLVAIVPVEPIVSAKPNKTASILVDAPNRIVGQTLVNAYIGYWQFAVSIQANGKE